MSFLNNLKENLFNYGLGAGATVPDPQPQVSKDREKTRNYAKSQGINIQGGSPSLEQIIEFANRSKQPTPTPQPQVLGATNAPSLDSYFQENVFPTTREAGFPDKVSTGMFAAESRDLNGLGARRNNPYNIGAYDSNPDNAFDYESPQAGVQAFVDLLMNDPRYIQAMELKDDPMGMLQAIQNANYAGDPATYGERADNGYNSYSDFVSNTPEWRYY